jgi:hypothetical protein
LVIRPVEVTVSAGKASHEKAGRIELVFSLDTVKHLRALHDPKIGSRLEKLCVTLTIRVSIMDSTGLIHWFRRTAGTPRLTLSA